MCLCLGSRFQISMLPESMRCAQGIPCDVSSRRGMGAAAARRAFIDDSVMSVSSDSDGQDDLVLVEDQQSPAGFMEIFSPPRVALHVVPRGMTSEAPLSGLQPALHQSSCGFGT